MNTDHLRGLVEWSLMVALVLGTGAIARAQQDQDQSQPEGRIVQIGPADESPTPPESDEALPPPQPQAAPGPDQQPPVVSPSATRYWIGILGGPVSPALRAQLDIPDNQGLLVRDVVPDSPAAKAGIQKYDVLLRANDNDLSQMSDLVDLVRTTGEQKGQFSLELLRRGQRETVQITPAERPEQLEQPGGFGRGGSRGDARDFLHPFRMNGPFEFRSFGPGVIVGRGLGLARLPNGVSVVIQKQDNEPAHITVKRGNETWEVVGDDPESLEQLPADLRPFVEQMIHGNAMPDIVMPDIPNTMPMPQFDDQQFQQRLNEMQEQLQQLQQQFQGLQQQSGQEPN
jgi:hypothetical protein